MRGASRTTPAQPQSSPRRSPPSTSTVATCLPTASLSQLGSPPASVNWPSASPSPWTLLPPATAPSPNPPSTFTAPPPLHQTQPSPPVVHLWARGVPASGPPSGAYAPNLEGQAGTTTACCSPLAARPTVAAATSTIAALLLLLAPPGPLAGPAAARIPTEAVLSDSGGGAAAATPSGRSALLQLAVPPSAVVALAGTVQEPEAGAEAGPGPSGPIRGSGSELRRGLAPGTVVGTPNYARGPIAGPGSRSTASEAAAALQLLGSAREAVDEGQHDRALELYSRLVTEHPDLALAEYGRIGRAMMLYQVGRTSDSILALEDEEAVMRGAAEVHAALAALLYSERPNLALRAEEEWNLACLFDKRYSDPDWVRTSKHWPPRMIAALQRFLSLS